MRTPLLFLLLFMGGCALFRPSEEPATDAAAEESGAGTHAEPAPEDLDAELDTGANDPGVSAAPAEEKPSDADIPPEAESEGSHESASPTAEDSAPEDTSLTEGDVETALEPAVVAAPEILIELSAQERQELETSARVDLRSARERSQRTRSRNDLSAEQSARLETLDQYIALAMEALEKDDVRAASSLALKARLLGEELAPN